MRIRWWVPLIPTVAAVIALMAAPPMSGHGEPCAHPTAVIIISPGYTDGEMAGQYGDHRTCAPAGWRAAGFAGGIGAAGGAVSWVLHRAEVRRTDRSTGSDRRNEETSACA